MNKRVALISALAILICVLLVGIPSVRNILRQGATAILSLVPTYISSPIATFTYTITPVPPPPPNGFKIYWGINTQIEPLADMVSGSVVSKDVEKLKNIVQGYYFNVLPGGTNSYWPERPFRCTVNWKHVGDTIKMYETTDGVGVMKTYTTRDLFKECSDLLDAHLKTGQDQGNIHRAAIGRALANLDMKGERAQGKPLTSEMLLSNLDFHYSSITDTLTMVYAATTGYHFPKSYAALTDLGFPPSVMMAYEEPSIQVPNGTNIGVPLKKGGAVVTLPQNGRITNMVGDAFVGAGEKSPKILSNLRIWTDSMKAGAEISATSKYFGGFNFEGGTSKLDATLGDETSRVDNFAEGMAWILAHTTKNVSILMPGYRPEEELASMETYDTNQISRIKKYVTVLNGYLIGHGFAAGVCSERIILIPAGYGSDVHPQMFPVARNGHLAGTTGGQIVAMDQVRTKLCGAL